MPDTSHKPWTPVAVSSPASRSHRFQPSPAAVVAPRTVPRQIQGVTNPKIRIRENFPAAPICPQCGKEIHEIAARQVESTLGVRFLYYCCECRKVLGVSHRKGFWMG